MEQLVESSTLLSTIQDRLTSMDSCLQLLAQAMNIVIDKLDAILEEHPNDVD